MQYTVTELVNRSYYLAGVLSKGVETIDSDQLSEGISLLNELLVVKSANQRLIPYFKEYKFNAVPTQEKYFVPKLVLAETLTFLMGSVRFSTYPEGRKDYQGSSRAENVTSLPYKWHFEREKGGASIYLYFNPNIDYPLTIWGKFSLDEVVFNEDLLLTYDRFYIAYLRYALAEYICQEYNIVFLPQNQKKLDEFENTLVDISPMDMTCVKRTMFNGNNYINYGVANLSNGFI